MEVLIIYGTSVIYSVVMNYLNFKNIKKAAADNNLKVKYIDIANYYADLEKDNIKGLLSISALSLIPFLNLLTSTSMMIIYNRDKSMFIYELQASNLTTQMTIQEKDEHDKKTTPEFDKNKYKQISIVVDNKPNVIYYEVNENGNNIIVRTEGNINNLSIIDQLFILNTSLKTTENEELASELKDLKEYLLKLKSNEHDNEKDDVYIYRKKL